MEKIVLVRLRDFGQAYFYRAVDLEVKEGDLVIAEHDRGLDELGKAPHSSLTTVAAEHLGKVTTALTDRGNADSQQAAFERLGRDGGAPTIDKARPAPAEAWITRLSGGWTLKEDTAYVPSSADTLRFMSLFIQVGLTMMLTVPVLVGESIPLEASSPRTKVSTLKSST